MIDERNGSDSDMPEDNVAAQAASARQYDWRPRPDPTVLTTQQLRETETQLNRTIVERINGLRELLEQRLAGMDQATELVAEQLSTRPDRISITALRELIQARLDAMDKAAELLATTVGKVPSETDKAIMSLRDLLSSRIDGMDTATKLLADSVSKFPSDIDRAVGGLKTVLLGEIKRVQDVNQERFLAIDGTFASNALALTAALAAQKEAAAEQNKSNTLAIDRANSATKETIAANAAQTANSLTSQAATVADLKERVVRIESTGAGASATRSEARLSQAAIVSLAVGIFAIIGVVVAVIALVHHP